MQSGRKTQDPQSSSIQSPTDQLPLKNNSLEERGSDVLEKPSQEEGKTQSSQLSEISTQERESEPKTDKEENSKETELRSRNSCTAPSGASLGDERHVTLEKNTRKVPDADHSSDSEETWDACPRRPQRRRTGHRKRPRSVSSEVQPPPLRKSLVTSLRAMSEAIRQNTVQLQSQRVPSPLSREQLAQLRGRLCAQAQTIYAMATQAAYGFPAEGWLVPGPLPGPRRIAGDGGEAQGSS